MNTVSVRFEPLKRYPVISVDGETVSPYSDLAGCENKDLHVCGKRLLKLLDEELGNEYRIELTGSRFQIEMLSALEKESAFCAEVRGKDPGMAFNANEILEFARGLCNKYGYDIDRETRVRIGGDLAYLIRTKSVITDEPAEICVVGSLPDELGKGRTVLLLSDRFDIRNTRGVNIVEVPDQYKETFIEYYRYYTKFIPFIEAVFSRAKYSPLTRGESLLIEAYSTQKPQYLFEIEKTALEAGESVGFQFAVFPSSASDMYQLRVDRADAVKIGCNSVTALKDGPVTLSVTTPDGVLCDSRQLSISSHSYVTNIKLIPSAVNMEVGKKGRIKAYIVPENAEDAGSLQWTSSNPDAVHVTSEGEVIGLEPGEAVITVASTNCTQRVPVTVYPPLENITLSSASLTLQADESRTIACNLFPPDASPGEICWELSSMQLGTIETSKDGRTCLIHAGSAGRGVLTCRIKGTDKKVSCPITVTPEKRPTGLITCTIIFSVIGMVFSFLIPLIYYTGSGPVGFFFDFFLPIGILLSLIGLASAKWKKPFATMLTLDLICTVLMYIIAFAACEPPY